MALALIVTGSVCGLLALVLLILFFYAQNNDVSLTEYTLFYDNLPAAFNGFRILQVSDLHNKLFKRNQQKLIALSAQAAPDVIAVTGDMADHAEHGNAAAYFSQAVRLAPCYYVSGNHEARSNWYHALKIDLNAMGMIPLDDASVTISRGRDSITLCGVADPAFSNLQPFSDRLAAAKRSGFTVLLSHRPELLNDYAALGFDLALTGHAHGGQFRFPLLGGLYAPDQGVFPKYTNGVYEKNGTKMEVSRGLGKSRFPLRLFNRPELVLITLKVK